MTAFFGPWAPGIPEAERLARLRVLRTLGLYRQMAGRSLRPAPGKADLLLLDHAGATFQHGGKGFVQLERWLGEADALFLRRDRAEPLVLVPWRTWARLIGRAKA